MTSNIGSTRNPNEAARQVTSERTGEPGTASAPLVSVIMPAYNAARYIEESIDSVLGQDYPNKELIIIDDGSTDATVDLIRAYGDRVTLITQQNQGAAVARNAGLNAARGDYIAFIDSDDVWLPGKLRTQVRYLENHPDVGLVYSRWHKWKPDADGHFPAASTFVPTAEEQQDEEPGLTTEGSGWLYTRLLFVSKLHTITVVARRSLIDEVGGFDTTLKRGQDYDYWIRASRVTRIHQLDRPLALYRIHDDGCMTKYPDINYELLVVQKALEKWGRVGPDGSTVSRAAIRRRLAEASFSFGYFHYWEGTPRIASKAFAQAAVHDPLKLAGWMYLLLSTARLVWYRGS